MAINILDAKNRLSQLIRAAQAGEEVVIANRGEPVARLVAIAPKVSPIGSPAAILGWLKASPAGPGRSAHDIDAAIADERAAWD